MSLAMPRMDYIALAALNRFRRAGGYGWTVYRLIILETPAHRMAMQTAPTAVRTLRARGYTITTDAMATLCCGWDVVE